MSGRKPVLVLHKWVWACARRLAGAGLWSRVVVSGQVGAGVRSPAAQGRPGSGPFLVVSGLPFPASFQLACPRQGEAPPCRAVPFSSGKGTKEGSMLRPARHSRCAGGEHGKLRSVKPLRSLPVPANLTPTHPPTQLTQLLTRPPRLGPKPRRRSSAARGSSAGGGAPPTPLFLAEQDVAALQLEVVKAGPGYYSSQVGTVWY